jgi:hypothetical protein
MPVDPHSIPDAYERLRVDRRRNRIAAEPAELREIGVAGMQARFSAIGALPAGCITLSQNTYEHVPVSDQEVDRIKIWGPGR